MIEPVQPGEGDASVRDKINALIARDADMLVPERFGAAGDGETDDTAALQAAIDALRAAGGGRLHLSGRYRVSGRRRPDGTWPGWVARDQNRGAPHALVIFDAADISVEFGPDAVLDRSGDADLAEGDADLAATLYLSNARRCRIVRPRMVGHRMAADMLRGRGGGGSGNHVVVNRGSRDCVVVDGHFGAGATAVAVGQNAGPGDGPDHLDPVVDLELQGTQVYEECETGLLVAAADGVLAGHQICRAGEGAMRRGVTVRSGRDVSIRLILLDGVFGAGLRVGPGEGVESLSVGALSGAMLTEAEMVALRGAGLTRDEGIAIDIAGGHVERVRIGDVDTVSRTGLRAPNRGIAGLRLSGRMRAAASGLLLRDPEDAEPPARAVRGLRLEALDIEVGGDLPGYAATLPEQGLHLGFASDLPPGEILLDGVDVRAPVRNARIFHARGAVRDSRFEQDLSEGGAEARDYDLVYEGELSFSNVRLVNYGRPNLPDGTARRLDNTLERLDDPEVAYPLPYNGRRGLAPPHAWRTGRQFERLDLVSRMHDPYSNRQDSALHVQVEARPATGGAGVTTETRALSFNIHAKDFSEPRHGIRGIRGEAIADGGGAKTRGMRLVTAGVNGHDGLITGALITAARSGAIPTSAGGDGVAEYQPGDAGPYLGEDAVLAVQAGAGIRRVIEGQGANGKERPQSFLALKGGNQALLPEIAVIDLHAGGRGMVMRVARSDEDTALIMGIDRSGAVFAPSFAGTEDGIRVEGGATFVLELPGGTTGFLEWWVRGSMDFAGYAHFRTGAGGEACREIYSGHDEHVRHDVGVHAPMPDRMTVSVDGDTIRFANGRGGAVTLDYRLSAS